jgi:hypothetical protein
MLQTLVLAAAMSFGPAQGGLELSNARVTFGGEFGPTRPDTRFLPGDIFFLAFDIDGLTAGPDGKVEYFMGMTVVDGGGKVLFESKPEPQAMILPLGAAKLPARAFVHLGLDLKPGPCSCKVVVIDKTTNVSKSIDKNFEVVAPAFGIVCFHTSYDKEDNFPSPMTGVAGQSMWMHFVTVSFGRDPQTKQPNNTVEMRVIDAAGRPTTQAPLAYVVKQGVKEDQNGIDWDLPLPLNRPGTYTVELKATDALTGKNYKMTFPVTVTPSLK